MDTTASTIKPSRAPQLIAENDHFPDCTQT
jgi:hypothetical protein